MTKMVLSRPKKQKYEHEPTPTHDLAASRLVKKSFTYVNSTSLDTKRTHLHSVCVYFSLFIKLVQAFPIRITLSDYIECDDYYRAMALTTGSASPIDRHRWHSSRIAGTSDLNLFTHIGKVSTYFLIAFLAWDWVSAFIISNGAEFQSLTLW